MNPEAWHDTRFTTSDLFRISAIENKPTKNDDEQFLVGMIDKFFMHIADLKDSIKSLEQQIADADGGSSFI